jgi:hypothetical protein
MKLSSPSEYTCSDPLRSVGMGVCVAKAKRREAERGGEVKQRPEKQRPIGSRHPRLTATGYARRRDHSSPVG